MKRFFSGLGVAVCCVAVCAAADDAGAAWSKIWLAHAHRYPQLAVQDCYKLLVQATLGAEHAAPSEAAAIEWMQREVAALEPGPVEPAIESLTPDGVLVRVHLRPWLARGGDSVELAKIFAATGRRKFGTTADLAARWEGVIGLAAEGRLPFTAAAAREFGAKMRAAGWPAVHHTKEFAQAYRPAYRVVARDLLPAKWREAQ